MYMTASTDHHGSRTGHVRQDVHLLGIPGRHIWEICTPTRVPGRHIREVYHTQRGP